MQVSKYCYNYHYDYHYILLSSSIKREFYCYIVINTANKHRYYFHDKNTTAPRG